MTALGRKILIYNQCRGDIKQPKRDRELFFSFSNGMHPGPRNIFVLMTFLFAESNNHKASWKPGDEDERRALLSGRLVSGELT